jgi:hypothetical protein
MKNPNTKQTATASGLINNRVRTVTYDTNGGRLYSGTYDSYVTSDGEHFSDRQEAESHERDILIVSLMKD